ncbi:dUTP diphosphatase [Zhaonella formicivorans]|uniref:dUTP diphosphatase n=1 Tax=Zhaonella formicivorans TaxID=2528593 RepID=UPI001D11AD66|nr:dUTP diphosphatase [Zhaonella formicivorans]
MEFKLKIKKMSPLVGQKVPLPSYATPGSAGLDLRACLEHPLTLYPGAIAKVPTGLAIEMPSKFMVGLVCARSGLASKHGINLINGVGIIDSDYTGEIICPVYNSGTEAYTIKPGERIAQILFLPLAVAQIKVVEELHHTDRGAKGFGSTGTN